MLFIIEYQYLTCNGDEVGVTDLNDVVSGYRLGVFSIGIDYEWSDTTPGR